MPILLNKTLHQVTGRGHQQGDLGIEIEAEGVFNNLPRNAQYWTIHQDNSLRGGFEFITFDPRGQGVLPFTHLSQALDEWEGFSKDNEIYKDTPRTSVHVHVNASRFTIKQIYTALAAYYTLENILVEYCGESRVGNLFCLRMKDAEWTMDHIIREVTNHNYFRRTNNERFKYGALNLYALNRYCSFEFRMMKGIYARNEIDSWVNLLYGLVTRTIEMFGTPKEVLEYFDNTNAETFARRVLTDKYFELLVKNNPRWLHQIHENYDYLYRLGTCIDWNNTKDKVKYYFHSTASDIDEEGRPPEDPREDDFRDDVEALNAVELGPQPRPANRNRIGLDLEAVQIRAAAERARNRNGG